MKKDESEPGWHPRPGVKGLCGGFRVAHLRHLIHDANNHLRGCHQGMVPSSHPTSDDPADAVRRLPQLDWTLLAPCLPSSLLTCAYPAVGPLLASAHHHQPLPSQITEPHIHQQTHKSDKSHTQQTHIDVVSATTAHPTNPIPAPNPLLEGISSPASVPSQKKGCLGE